MHRLVEAGMGADDVRRDWFDRLIYALILLNILAAMLETVQELGTRYAPWFAVFETVSIGIFSLEYLLRIWACVEAPVYRRPVLGRLKFILSPMALVDLLAIAPFYLPLLLPDLRVVRVLRFVRMVRIFKVGRYSTALSTIGRVVRSKREDLLIVLSLAAMLIVVASTLMYFAEHDQQPRQFSSIPASMWWAAMTLTTVGYGDVYPITAWGKVLAAIIAFAGIGLFALPTGILAVGFAQELEKRRSRPKCPHCGKELDAAQH